MKILFSKKSDTNTLYKALINEERIVQHEDSTSQWEKAQLR
jgi:hypothetical protein